jgi:RNA polymerase sigma factor (TIGR02999 family)
VTQADNQIQDRVTVLLHRAQSGDADATNQLFPVVYEELRGIAASFLSRERAGHTLQPTALVNEAYLRLVRPELPWESRGHFFSAASRAIRRILTDHARARGRDKRGGKGADRRQRVPLEGVEVETPGEAVDVLALDEALTRLAAEDEQKARVVELRYFGGLTEEQTAQVLGVSVSTVGRDWRFARSWLRRELSGETAQDR